MVRSNAKKILSHLKFDVMKKYWWIISFIENDFVGGEGPDDPSYPIQKRRVLKFSGPNDEITYKKIISEISSIAEKGKMRLDFVWCLGNDGEEESFLAEILYVYLKDGPLFR